jgi:hypothetical protein
MYFCRTKAEPPIYYLPNKPLDEDAASIEKSKEEVTKLRRHFICFGLHLMYHFDHYGQPNIINPVKFQIFMLFVCECILMNTLDSGILTFKMYLVMLHSFHLCKLQDFLEWKNARREELSEYQKQIGDQYLANVEKDLERWQNARNARKVNNDQNLQETMDKELDTHRLEHGPKKRKIPDGNNNEDDEDDDDVEDINVGEDDMIDDELDDDSGRRIDETIKMEMSNTTADPAADADNVDLK